MVSLIACAFKSTTADGWQMVPNVIAVLELTMPEIRSGQGCPH
jgi:hypothetical protein